jgi:hypothetical protein
MNNSRRFHPITILFLLLGAAAALTTLVARHLTESRNRTVELTVDYPQVRLLASAARVSIPQTLRALREAGVVSVALTEETLGDLAAAGAAEVNQEWDPRSHQRVTRVRLVEPGLFDRVVSHLQRRLRVDPSRARLPLDSRSVSLSAPEGRQAVLPATWEEVRGLGVGLPTDETGLVREAGLGIVGRVGNFTGARDESIDWVLAQLHESGARVVIFTGEEVLGYQARVEATAHSLDAHHLVYGSVELSKQRGDEELGKALDAAIVRVHAILPAELARLAPPVAIERYVRAVRERNIRVAYLRLFTSVAEDPLAENLDFVRGVAGDLRDRGYEIGPAQPFGHVLPEGWPRRVLPPLAALIVAGAGVMLLAGLAPVPSSRQLLLALLFGVGAMGLAAVGGGLGRKLLAFAGAVMLPTLAFVLFPMRPWDESATADRGRPTADGRPQTIEGGRRSAVGRPPVLFALSRFAMMSLISFLGALAVVGLLSERAALVKLTEFSGIKVAHVLPLLAVAVIYAADLLAPDRDWAEHRRRAVARVTGLLEEPLRLWHVLAAVLGLTALALVVLRTGNDPGVGVSPLELKFRSLLDQVLVRPRTKEFLVGHPALIVALALWAMGRGRAWIVPLLFVGAIGQESLVNSFCHLHTPIALTLARTWNSLWLGSLIGLAVVLLVVAPRRRPAEVKDEPPRHKGHKEERKEGVILR